MSKKYLLFVLMVGIAAVFYFKFFSHAEIDPRVLQITKMRDLKNYPKKQLMGKFYGEVLHLLLRTPANNNRHKIKIAQFPHLTTHPSIFREITKYFHWVL